MDNNCVLSISGWVFVNEEGKSAFDALTKITPRVCEVEQLHSALREYVVSPTADTKCYLVGINPKTGLIMRSSQIAKINCDFATDVNGIFYYL